MGRIYEFRTYKLHPATPTTGGSARKGGEASCKIPVLVRAKLDVSCSVEMAVHVVVEEAAAGRSGFYEALSSALPDTLTKSMRGIRRAIDQGPAAGAWSSPSASGVRQWLALAFVRGVAADQLHLVQAHGELPRRLAEGPFRPPVVSPRFAGEGMVLASAVPGIPVA